MTKILKPGQLCTINKHVYHCKKTNGDICDTCWNCEKVNNSSCILMKNNYFTCAKIFGMTNYPVLVK